jgi:hypothetical protein
MGRQAIWREKEVSLIFDQSRETSGIPEKRRRSAARRRNAAASRWKKSRARSTVRPLSISPAARARLTSTMRAGDAVPATSGSTEEEATTSDMTCHRSASVIRRAEGSPPTSMPWACAMSEAKALYVETVARSRIDRRARPSSGAAGMSPARRTAAREDSTRRASSPAALRVKVSPRTSSGRTAPRATW